jgi:Flp pilus assembly protein TadD
MDARARRSLAVLLASALWAGGVEGSAQKSTGKGAGKPDSSTGKTIRKVRIAEEEINVAPAVIQAETFIEKGDYAKAEPLLVKVVELDPNDFRAWFDLAFVYNLTGRKLQAIDAYRKSVALKPTVQEANLNLGLLLATQGRNDEAARYLRAATTLKPDSKDHAGTYRAWLSLGRVLHQIAPADAVEAFRQAAKLQPKDVEPWLSLASLLEKSSPAEAEGAYKHVLELEPASTPAMAGLVDVYSASGRLPEAEAFLRQYLETQPENVQANLLLGRFLVKAGKPEEALAHFETGLKAKPDDRDLLLAVAALSADAKKWPAAEERYRSLVKLMPEDAAVRRELAATLMQQRKFAEAIPEFFTAIKLDPKNAANYADLAIVAAQEKNFPLAIRALDERAKYAPELPATYFLRATSYDNLKAYKEAAENYRKFLDLANGRFPDQEWQARHRLIAIEPEKKK